MTTASYVPGQILTAASLNAILNSKPDASNAQITGGFFEGADHVYVVGTTPSTSPTTGAVTVAGGVGVSGAVNAGGNVSAGGSISATGGVTAGGGGTFTGPLTSAAKALSVNASNLLVNSTGEFGNLNWSSSVFAASVGAAGQGSIFMNGSLVNTAQKDTQQVNIAAGVALVISAEILASGVVAGRAFVSVEAFNASNASLGVIALATIANGSNGFVSASGTTPTNTAYVLVSKGVDTSPNVPIGGLIFRRMKLEVGTAASLYSQEASMASAAGNANGELALTVTGGSLTLTSDQFTNAIIKLSGVLTSNQTITTPATPHPFMVVNNTTGSYTVTFVASGKTPSTAVAQGVAAYLYSDATGCYSTSSALGPVVPGIFSYGISTTLTQVQIGGMVYMTGASTVATLPLAASYPKGTGVILAFSATGCSIATQGSDTADVTTPYTCYSGDRFALISDGVSAWKLVDWANKVNPSFDGALRAQNLTITGSGGLTFQDGTVMTTSGVQNGEFGVSTTGGTTTVSQTQAYPNNIFKVTGALTSNATVAFPAAPKSFVVQNATTGSFTLTVIATGQTPSVLIAQGSASSVITDSTGAYASSASITAANPNLLYNSSAEFGTYGWSLGADFSALVDAAGGIGSYFGNKNAIASPITYSNSTPSVKVGAGVNMSCSVDVLNQSSAGTVSISFAAYNASGTFISNIGSQTVASGTPLTRYTMSGTTPANTASVKFSVNFTSSVVPAYGLVFRRVKIEDGLTASPYSQEANFPQLLQNVSPVILSGGLTFSDGTVQTTANSTTQPASTWYVPGTTDTVGSYADGDTAIRTSGFVSPFVRVIKNGLTLTLNQHYTLNGDGIHVNFTDPLQAATGDPDQVEVRTQGVYNPSSTYLPALSTLVPVAGATTIAYPHTVGFALLFLRGALLKLNDDYTEDANGFYLTGFSADGVETFTVWNLTPVSIANALTSTSPVITAGGLTFPDGSIQTTAPLSNRNVFVDGAFDFWAGGTPSGNGHTSTMWIGAPGTGGTMNAVSTDIRLSSVQQYMDSNPINCYTHTQSVASTGSVAARNTAYVYNKIEGVQTLSGKSATFSVKLWANAPMTISSIFAAQVFGTGGSPSASTVLDPSVTWNVTTTPQKFSIRIDFPSIAGKTIGTNANDSVIVGLWLPPGVTFTLNLAEAQLELSSPTAPNNTTGTGGSPTPFEYRGFPAETDRMRRYYETGVATIIGYAAAAGSFGYQVSMHTSKRIAPALSTTNTFTSNASATVNSTNIGNDGFMLYHSATAAGGCQFIDSWYADSRL